MAEPPAHSPLVGGNPPSLGQGAKEKTPRGFIKKHEGCCAVPRRSEAPAGLSTGASVRQHRSG